VSEGRKNAERGSVLKGLLIFLLVCTALVGGCVYACVKKTGEALSAVGRKFDGDWDAEERKADPEGYLNYLIARLETAARELDRSADGLRHAAAAAKERGRQNEEDYRRAVADLAELKAAYRAGGPPYAFGGEALDEDALKRRTASALSVRDVHERATDAMRRQVVAIEDELAKIPEKLADAKARIAALETERDVLRARRSTETLARAVENAATALDRLENSGPSTPLRSLEEIEKDAARAGATTPIEALSFLKGT
jgi:phage shock protein A